MKASASAPLILGFNFLSTVILINLNKWVFARVHFGYPAALSNVHYVVNYGVLAALRSINPAWVPALEPTKAAPWRDANFVAMAVLLGAVTPLNNMSLKLNPIGFYQIAKLAVTPLVVVLEYGLDGKRISPRRAAALCAVCAFVLKMPRRGGEAAATAAGVCVVLLWVPLRGAASAASIRARHRRRRPIAAPRPTRSSSAACGGASATARRSRSCTRSSPTPSASSSR